MTALPPLEITIASQDMVAYAGATWDWHRLHHDTAYVKAKGIDRPVVDGQVFGAYFAAHIAEHLGPEWFVTDMSIRFRSMVLAGDTVRISSAPLDDRPDRYRHAVHVGDRLCVTGETGVRRGR